jgi:chromosome segregation ATPase
VEERLYELEKLKESTLVDMTPDESSDFNAIMKLMAENKKKLEEANNAITKLEKQSHDTAKSYEKKVHRMKKRITALEEKCLEKDKLKERVVVLENQVEMNNCLTDRVKLLECLMANIKMNHLDIGDNTGYSTCSSSNVNSDPEVITFDKKGSKNI